MEQEIDYTGIIELYFGEMDDAFWVSAEEQWKGWSRFVDLLCTILLMRKEADPPLIADRIGCLLRDEEIMRALEPSREESFPAKNELRKIFLKLMEKGLPQEADDELYPLSSLMAENMLEPVEWMALMAAFCVHRNRKYERVFGILQEESESILMPTVGLVHDLCGLFLSEQENSVVLLLDKSSFLNRMILTEMPVPAGLSLLSTPLMINHEAYAFLLGEDSGLGELSSFAEEVPCHEEDFVCHEALMSDLLLLYAGLNGYERNGLIFLDGEEGSGRTFLMEQLAAAAGGDLLAVSLEELLVGRDKLPRELLQNCIARSYFRQELLYFKDFSVERIPRELISQCIAFVRERLGILFVGGTGYRTGMIPSSTGIHLLNVPYPDVGQQRRFWQYFADEAGITLGENVDIDVLVSKYSMTPGRIREVMESVLLMAEITEDGIFADNSVIEAAVRGKGARDFGSYAVQIDPVFTMEDLALAEESERALRMAMDRIRLKSVVNGQYGFEKKLPYGDGVSIVLYGPPGTGKSMTAHVLAKELGLDLYRIDLSQVESKYIGETEKSLGKIFDAARYSNAILFFDEADSLFTKRTEVKDSHDKHANAQTAYLLQKIEEYRGVSILATNIFQSFDEAFRRRMTFLIPVRWPDEEERLILWEKVFPRETPLAEDVQFSYYAKTAELTGSSIKSIAVSAAYIAAKERRPVCHRDIMDAMAAEYTKLGRTLVV